LRQGVLQVFAKCFEDTPGRFLFEFLDDPRSRFGGLRFQEEMEVLRHQDPADEQAIHLLPDFLEALDEVVAEALGKENGRPPVGAGGGELQFTRAVSAM